MSSISSVNFPNGTPASVNSPIGPEIQALVSQESQLQNLTLQLSTGQKTTTYSGIGSQAQLLVGLNSQISAISGFQTTNNVVNARLSIAQSALTEFDSVTQSVQQSAMQSTYAPGPNGQTPEQVSAGADLNQLLNLLNTQADNGYLFSGAGTNQPSVASSNLILNGTSTQAGLIQVIQQRNEADLGTNGLGRLVVPAPSTSPASITGTGATIAPDAAAVVSGTANISNLSSSAGNLVINGQTIAIAAGASAQTVETDINQVSTTTGVSASINATNQLVLTSKDANTAVAIGGGSTPAVLSELGLGAGTTNPTNLVTQGLSGSFTITVGANPPLAINIGAGQITTLAQLNSTLQTLTGGTAGVNTGNGNISIAATNTTDDITIGGTPATAALFGLQTALAIPTSGTRVSLSEDVAGSPFGFKLGGVSSTLTGANVLGPTGSPAQITVDLSTNPNPGDSLNVTLNLPDGTTTNLTLTATNTNPPPSNEFTIGTTAAATAANLQQAMTASLGTLAQTQLTAASAAEAANNFFDVDVSQPPQRVNATGTPPSYATATSLINGTAANTVTWYTGDMGTGAANALNSVTARVDSSLTVSYGMQANEQAFTSVIKNVAVFAAMSFSPSNSNSTAAYSAVAQRVGQALLPQSTNGNQTTTDIETALANAQDSIQAVTSQQQQTQTTLQDFVQGITGVSNDQVAAEITTLQTQLDASLETTAILSKISLVNYVSGVSG
jgi:flagellin-like hook-associated protein FlgL